MSGDVIRLLSAASIVNAMAKARLLCAKHSTNSLKFPLTLYDGASNMRGEFNGLKSLIMRDNNTTYYVHCFAHQLRLVVVAVVRKNREICQFFSWISTLLNVVGGSAKRRDMIRDINLEEVSKVLGCGLL
jgi:hypothetical protein